jgi:hypothetical protein
VGVYSLAARTDSERVPAGKALVLTLELSGRGNIKNVRLPELTELPGFRVFAPTVTDAVETDGAGLHGTKKAEILLMPERGGRIEIPSIEMTIFNPLEKRYQRLETGSKRIVVEGDPSAAAGETIAPSERPREEPAAAERIQRPSLRPLRYRSALGRHREPPWKNELLIALFFAPPLLFLGVRAGRSVWALSRRETATSRRRAKTKEARARLSKAREAVKAGDTANAYREMREALLDFASERSGAALRGMTIEEARLALEARGAPQELVASYVAEMEAADYVRFAPAAIDRLALEGAADRWESLFAELEAFSPKEAAR